MQIDFDLFWNRGDTIWNRGDTMAYHEIGSREYDRALNVIRELLHLGCDFEFIESVEDYMYNYNRVTLKQLKALESILKKWENRE